MKKDKLGAKLRAIFLTKDEEDTLQKIAKAKSLAILNLIFGRLSPNTEKALLEMAVCLWKQNPPKANYCRLYLWWRQVPCDSELRTLIARAIVEQVKAINIRQAPDWLFDSADVADFPLTLKVIIYQKLTKLLIYWNSL